MSAATDVKGLKRVCVECGIRFYDMNKRPIICPGCSTEFTGIEKPKGRKGRAVIEEVKPKVANNDTDAAEKENEAEDSTAEINLDDNAPTINLEGDITDTDSEKADKKIEE